MIRNFGISKQLNLVLFKVYAELKAEASRSYLGVVWWLLEPVLYLGAFYVLFVLVLQREGNNFIPDFLCGIVVWKLFDSGVKSGSNSLVVNASLLQQVAVPKYIFPLSAVIVVTLKFILVFIVLCLFIMIYEGGLANTWLWSIPLMLLQFLLVISLAFLAGALVPFVPDLRVAIDNGMMFLFFISGVFFDVSSTHEPVKSLLMINPMAFLINGYRDVLLHGARPDLGGLAGVLALSLFFLLAGLFLLGRLSLKYGKARF